MSLLKAVATVGGYTMISRMTGFIRDILIAATLGAGPIADAFIVAFKLPNFFRRSYITQRSDFFFQIFNPHFSTLVEGISNF